MTYSLQNLNETNISFINQAQMIRNKHSKIKQIAVKREISNHMSLNSTDTIKMVIDKLKNKIKNIKLYKQINYQVLNFLNKNNKKMNIRNITKSRTIKNNIIVQKLLKALMTKK